MRCDSRVELRLTAREKEELSRAARASNATVSAFLRRAIKATVAGTAPIGRGEASEIAVLRRRLNAIEAQVTGALAAPEGEQHSMLQRIGPAVSQFRSDARRVLARCS
jgi:hypothetical protein